MTDISFASQYLDETVQALCFAVGGESKYWQLKCEIDAFVEMFNGLFTPIVEELQKIEGFDLYDEDDRKMILEQKKRRPKECPICAEKGEGFEKLLNCIEGMQTILTCTHAERVLYGAECNKIRIDNGRII